VDESVVEAEGERVKVRDSGMPEREMWERLFDVELILDRLQVDGALRDVVELGCGHGTFTIPVARRTGGQVRAYDVEPEMVEATRRRAADEGLPNVAVERRDVLVDGFGVPAGSQDACLLFNILHHDDPVALLALAADVVRPGGRVLVIHWRYDASTPRGPDLDIRPRPEQIVECAAATGALGAEGGVIDLPPWHYGLVLVRPLRPDRRAAG
jgi:SAM-dependent methyltransferase